MSRLLQRALVLLGALTLVSAVAAVGTSARQFRITAENLMIEGVVQGRTAGGVVVTCNMQLRGNVGGQIAKVVGTVIGRITEARFEMCMNGTIRANNLPWTKTYDGFQGTLPNITAFKSTINDDITARAREILELECRYRGMVGSFILPEGGRFRFDETVSIRSETAFCPEVSISGTPAVTPRIRAALI